MGANTKIEWCDFTFNPWRGCQKVAAGCVNCYAEAQSKRNPRTLGVWGPNGSRVVASESMWREPLKWNRAAECHHAFDCGQAEHGDACPQSDRPRVFCGSLCDVFEDWGGTIQCGRSRSEPFALRIDRDTGEWVRSIAAYDSCRMATIDDVRERLFRLIDSTPNLDWLLLTKRPENVRRMWCSHVNTDGRPPSQLRRENVWLGVSIACQDDADRLIPELLKCRDLAAKLFLSIEPLTELVDAHLMAHWCQKCGFRHARFDASCCVSCGHRHYDDPKPAVDWAIVGGESGPKARPCNVEWVRSVVCQCRQAGVPVFVKQLGAEVIDHDTTSATNFPADQCWPEGTKVDYHRVMLRDPKGGNPDEWPEDLRVREVP